MKDSSFVILDALAFVGVLIIKERKILFANKALGDILAWRPKDLVGKMLEVIFSETAYGIFLESFSRLEAGENTKMQTDALCQRQDKENIYCVFSLESLGDGRVVITVQDAANGGLVIDHLTGLYNRRAFFTLANHETETAKRFKRDLFVVFIDVDGLKKVNDNLGHAAGDELLRSVAEILRCTFRKSDVIARVGGDEFSVLALGEPGTIEALMIRLEAMVEIANQESMIRHGFSTSLSTGAVRYDPEKLFHLALKEADKKMYENKEKKR
ncbi:MAG: diguanylate cyclase [Patescibacteria group bacterium]